jgi:hypothetical protein
MYLEFKIIDAKPHKGIHPTGQGAICRPQNPSLGPMDYNFDELFMMKNAD